MKEKTSVGFSGVHFSYIKICAKVNFFLDFEAIVY